MADRHAGIAKVHATNPASIHELVGRRGQLSAAFFTRFDFLLPREKPLQAALLASLPRDRESDPTKSKHVTPLYEQRVTAECRARA